jgi:NAD(P)-dependent dehydrogenase (short-subunit alcohol dehydrogenase family)
MASHGIFDLTGKVAAIIGGASGIGEAVTLGAVAQGATVVCLDVAQDKAAAVAAAAAPTVPTSPPRASAKEGSEAPKETSRARMMG